MSATPNKYAFGMIGLGTMGRSLLLNMADHGYAVAGHDEILLRKTEGPISEFHSRKNPSA